MLRRRTCWRASPPLTNTRGRAQKCQMRSARRAAYRTSGPSDVERLLRAEALGAHTRRVGVVVAGERADYLARPIDLRAHMEELHTVPLSAWFSAAPPLSRSNARTRRAWKIRSVICGEKAVSGVEPASPD